MRTLTRFFVFVLVGAIVRQIERRFGLIGLLLFVGLILAAPYLVRAARLLQIL